MGKATRSDMFNLIDQWQGSGKNQTDFIRENNVQSNKFYYWLRKYRGNHTRGGFVPLEVTMGQNPVSQVGIGIEISYSNGTVIHLPATTDLAVIRHLIRI